MRKALLTQLILTIPLAWSFQVNTPRFLSRSRDSAHTSPRTLDRRSTVLHETLLADAAHQAATLFDVTLATKSLSNGVLSGIGDLLAQTQERNDDDDSKSFDLSRCRHFTLSGLGSGVLWAWWYDWADVASAGMGQSFLNEWGMSLGMLPFVQTSLCLVLEQFLASPVIFGLWSIPMPLLLSGASVDNAVHHVQSKLGGILVENAKVWTLANVVIYNIPLELRVLAMSVASILWQCIMSAAVTQDVGRPSADLPAATQDSASITQPVVAVKQQDSLQVLPFEKYAKYNLTDADVSLV